MNSFGIKGIVLRESYSEDAYQGKEVSYTQLALEYRRNGSTLGDLFINLGYNQIALNNKKYSSGGK